MWFRKVVRPGAFACCLSLITSAWGCGDTDHAPATVSPTVPRTKWPNPLEYAPRGETQRLALCARSGSDDLVHDLFCGDGYQPFTNLIDLQTALHTDAAKIGGGSGLSLSANSTALSASGVSAINPRLTAMRFGQPPLDGLTFGFTRGEQSVEFAVQDRNDLKLRFYLIAYRQPCNDTEMGCKPGDLLTPATESGWTDASPYDEEDLKDTVLDCRSCHQPDGPDSTKFLRMQELQTPWTHWLWTGSPGGRALLTDYIAAHGDEAYGGMPLLNIENSHPENMSEEIQFSNMIAQPNQFDSQQIEMEVTQSSSLQPADNSVPGQSETWQALYEKAKNGAAIPVPYHDVKITDRDKLAAMTKAYAAFRSGELAQDDLPDIRDVLPDDPQLLAEMGFTTEPNLDAQSAITQACSQCHNDRLDQTLSRANFNADLTKLARSEKDAAIVRLRLPVTDVHAMPPRRTRMLSDEVRAGMIVLLQQ